MTTPLPDEPAAAEFNLEVRDASKYIQNVVPVTSVDVLTNPNDYRTGTEFGGVDGLVQPPPHVPTARERRMQLMFIDPTDDGTQPGSVAVPDLEGDFT